MRPMNNIMVGTINKRFLLNVAQLDILSRSPKQPQSFTGFAVAIHSVSSVKNAINSIVAQAEKRRQRFISSIKPSRDSAAGRIMAKSGDRGSRNDRCIAPKYSPNCIESTNGLSAFESPDK